MDLQPKIYTAKGHVHFVQGKRVANAEHAVLNDITHDLYLTGNVHLEDKGQTLEAQSLHYNTQTQQVNAKQDVQIIVPLASPDPQASAAASPVPSKASRKRRHS